LHIDRGNDGMKIYKIQDYIDIKNPNPGYPYRPEILTGEHNAKDVGGMFGLLPPGCQVPYHYHKTRESIIIAISGEATEIIEGKEIPIKAGDILYIPSGEKHMTMNRSDKGFRYLEFFTCQPLYADFIEITE